MIGILEAIAFGLLITTLFFCFIVMALLTIMSFLKVIEKVSENGKKIKTKKRTTSFQK